MKIYALILICAFAVLAQPKPTSPMPVKIVHDTIFLPRADELATKAELEAYSKANDKIVSSVNTMMGVGATILGGMFAFIVVSSIVAYKLTRNEHEAIKNNIKTDLANEFADRNESVDVHYKRTIAGLTQSEDGAKSRITEHAKKEIERAMAEIKAVVRPEAEHAVAFQKRIERKVRRNRLELRTDYFETLGMPNDAFHWALLTLNSYHEDEVDTKIYSAEFEESIQKAESILKKIKSMTPAEVLEAKSQLGAFFSQGHHGKARSMAEFITTNFEPKPLSRG